MKILKMVLVGFLVLVVVSLLAVVIFIKTFDVNRYKPQITSQASQILGRKVDFQKARLDISLAKGINLKVDGLSIAEDTKFQAGDFVTVKQLSLTADALAYLRKKQVNIPGITIDSATANIIRNNDGSINAQTLAQNKSAAALPAQDAKMQDSVALVLPAFLIDPLRLVNAKVYYIDRAFDPPLKAVVDNISAEVKLTQAKVLINKLSADFAKGNITANGVISDYLNKQEYILKAVVKDVKLENMFLEGQLPVKLEGSASADIDLKGAGFTPQALENIAGSAVLDLVKIKLKDMNFLNMILERLAVVPGLSTDIQAGLSDKYKQRLQEKDTQLLDMKLTAVIAGGRILVENAVFGSDDFVFSGRIEADFLGAYKLEGTVVLSKELSADMVSKVKELEYLSNEQGQVYIPLKVSGKSAQQQFEIDAQYIAKKLLATQAKQQLFKAIEKSDILKEIFK